ncbi:MAG: hypothetical protein UX77_C0019G0005 [Parcubacteria group bacterium GW2011_GWA1_47_11]|nr:MAG: hypothetical protein UX77_C0019G0005 [Parcubacteria group bacterium GW2011_GWA1_47_11]
MPKLGGSLILVAAAGVIVVSLSVFAPPFLQSTYRASSSEDSPGELRTTSISPRIVPVTHLNTPEPLKALYMTSCVAGTPSWRGSLKRLIETTELNAVVIDIKTESGCAVPDLREFVSELHEAGIYVIGRISVFQDSSYTRLFPELAVKRTSDGEVWKDYKGLSFIDVGARPYWDYIVGLSKEAHALGFDELNYDYVRYPSDGDMKDALYTWTVGTTTKPEMLESFFKYLHDSMRDTDVKTSVDLFGMTTTVTSDMNIGQVFELTLPYFDYISPMVYPSHYPPTWNGFANPAEHPYEVVKIAMAHAIEREQFWLLSNNLATTTASKLRPWLQDFNLGATYGIDQVRAQIQATYDVGLTSWMLWNAGNRYTASALLPE